MKNKTKSSRVIIAILSLMLSFIILITGIKVVKANNSTDTTFSFDFTYGGEYRTNRREKTDPSGVYIYCYDSSDSNEFFYADVYGSDSSTDIGTYCGNGRSYPVSEGRVYYMYNWVYENYSGENKTAFAHIFGSASSSYVADFSCNWSPDNYRGYAGE